MKTNKTSIGKSNGAKKYWAAIHQLMSDHDIPAAEAREMYNEDKAKPKVYLNKPYPLDRPESPTRLDPLRVTLEIRDAGIQLKLLNEAGNSRGTLYLNDDGLMFIAANGRPTPERRSLSWDVIRKLCDIGL